MSSVACAQTKLSKLCLGTLVALFAFSSVACGKTISNDDDPSSGLEREVGLGGSSVGGATGAQALGKDVDEIDTDESNVGEAAKGGGGAGAGQDLVSGDSAGKAAGEQERLDCQDVSGMGMKPWHELRVSGSGFEVEDGARVRVMNGLG